MNHLRSMWTTLLEFYATTWLLAKSPSGRRTISWQPSLFLEKLMPNRLVRSITWIVIFSLYAIFFWAIL